MSEKIFLTYTNATSVPYQGSVLGRHVVLNYIDSHGDHHMLQGFPKQKFEHNLHKFLAFLREEYVSDGTNNTDSPFGRLDPREEDVKNKDNNVSVRQPHTMVAEGDDLSSRWALMRDFADEVNSIGYEYRPVSQNSNSFAGAALQRGALFGPGNAFPEKFDRQLVFDPASGETQSYYVPGFEKPLTNPINTATPMPFPLGALAPPPVPANSIPAPDRPVSFDGRFGNWGPIPADNTDSPGWPVLRALHEYKNLAAVDSVSSSSAPSPTRAGRDIPSGEPDFGDRLDHAAFGAPQSRRVSSAFPNATARNTNQPVQPTEPGPLLGIFSGEPMSQSPLPSSVWGVPDSSDSSADGDWFTRLAGPSSQTPQWPAQSPLDDILRRIDGDGTPRSWYAQR